MARINRQNIDRQTNVPNPSTTEGLMPDRLLNRANQIRRDDDVIRTPKRTLYDIDFAIKHYIDNEIQPQIQENQELVAVPTIFSSGEKWDAVRRLGYVHDEKGMIQCPLIMINRNSAVERDNMRTLDVNRQPNNNVFIGKKPFNHRTRFEKDPYVGQPTTPMHSSEIYIVDIPKYVTVEYDLLIWCNFTDQLNEVTEQILMHARYAWGNDGNRFTTSIGSITYETSNNIGEDRLVRATIPITVYGSLLSGFESRESTLKKQFSVKKVSFNTVVDVSSDIFSSTSVPNAILQSAQQINAGSSIAVNNGGTTTTITAEVLSYLINKLDKIATYVNSNTVTVSSLAAINPSNNAAATVNEFDLYINGQYIDKAVYTWTPSDIATQTITFDTAELGYNIESTDLVVINGRWA